MWCAGHGTDKCPTSSFSLIRQADKLPPNKSLIKCGWTRKKARLLPHGQTGFIDSEGTGDRRVAVLGCTSDLKSAAIVSFAQDFVAFGRTQV